MEPSADFCVSRALSSPGGQPVKALRERGAYCVSPQGASLNSVLMNRLAGVIRDRGLTSPQMRVLLSQPVGRDGDVASRLTVRTVDAMLRRHKRVVVRILKGNHDEHCAVAIAHFLYAWYRNEPRVEVDLDPSLFWYHRFGKVMLAATHGHETKLQDLPGVMAARRAEDWGLTRCRYAHGFHIHHKRLLGFEAGAVVAESHQAPVAQDAWHHGAGFLSGRSLQTITYHRAFGEVSRAREAILDAQPEGTA